MQSQSWRPVLLNVLLALFILLISSTGAAAADRYASPSGSGSSCSNGSPCSANTAIGNSFSGDTIYLKGGLYDHALGHDPDNPSSGTSNQLRDGITIRPAPGENPIVRQIWPNQPNITIDGAGGSLVLDGDASSAYGIGMLGGGCEDCVFKNFEIRNYREQGMLDCGHNCLYDNMRIHHISANFNQCFGGGLCHGLYLSRSGTTVQNSEFWEIREGAGVHPNVGTEGICNYTIRNNTFHDSVLGWYMYGASGSNCFLAYNNVVYNMSGSRMDANVGPTGFTAYSGGQRAFNNTFHNTGLCFFTRSGAEIRNNICSNASPEFDGGSTTSNNLCTGSGTGCQIANANPNFIDAGGGNFRLNSGSPAINAGTNSLLGLFNEDRDGNTRGVGGAWDIGAYEFGAASCVPANCPTGCCGDSCCPPNPDPAALVADIRFDEGTGTTASDSTGNGHSCALTSAGWAIPGIVGPADFNAAGVRSCTIANVTGLTTPALSVSLWIRGTALPSNTWCMYTTLETFQLCISPAGQPSFSAFTNQYHQIMGPANVQNGGNHHLVAAYSSDGGQRLWVDGVQVQSASASGNLTYAQGTLTQVGRYANNASTQYNGVIGQLRIYNYGLQQSDVTNLYNEQAPIAATAVTHSQLAKADAAQTEANLMGPIDTDQMVVVNNPIDMLFTVTRNGATTNVHYPLECSINGNPTFTQVTNSFGSLFVRIAANSVLNMCDNTVVPLPANLNLGGLTAVPGKVMADTINSGCTTPLNNSELTQLRYTAMFDPSLVGSTARCRPKGADTYMNIKTLSLVVPLTGRSLAGGTFRGITLK